MAGETVATIYRHCEICIKALAHTVDAAAGADVLLLVLRYISLHESSLHGPPGTPDGPDGPPGGLTRLFELPGSRPTEPAAAGNMKLKPRSCEQQVSLSRAAVAPSSKEIEEQSRAPVGPPVLSHLLAAACRQTAGHCSGRVQLHVWQHLQRQASTVPFGSSRASSLGIVGSVTIPRSDGRGRGVVGLQTVKQLVPPCLGERG